MDYIFSLHNSDVGSTHEDHGPQDNNSFEKIDMANVNPLWIGRANLTSMCALSVVGRETILCNLVVMYSFII